jgi:selenocysteine-specific elongation factor
VEGLFDGGAKRLSREDIKITGKMSAALILPEQTTARSHYVISLAGHIDHGKSALVQALTGGTVDRLPEEKRRGITIELGFAHFDANGRRYALIDVPGHERFIHTMVAGASGVDAALLVVAADDSVMPQTREHLALLELLGVQRGVIAITKCDLVDDEHLQLVGLEIDELVATTFLTSAPRVHVSAHAGTGIDELRHALVEAAKSSPARPAQSGRFRLPIDRAFSPSGQGAVVTGTVWRGAARLGDTLQLLPAGELVRLRRMQSQGKDVESVSSGERAAINVVGVKASDMRRGGELVTPHTVEPGRRHLVQIRMLADVRQGLRHRQLVRVHLGANQVTAQLLLEHRLLTPGSTAFALMRCALPIVAEYAQPFVLRQLSPAATIGGGTFIAPALRSADRLKRCLAAAPGLSSPDPTTRVAAYLDLRRELTFNDNSESWIGLSPTECEAASDRLAERKEVVRGARPQPWHVSTQRFNKLKQKMLRISQQELERRRPALQLPAAVIFSAMSHCGSGAVLEAVLSDLAGRGELIRRGDHVGLPGGAELTQRQRQLLCSLLKQFVSAGRTPPSLKELADQHKLALRDLEPLVQVAVDEGQLMRLAPQIVIDRDALESLRQSLAEHFQRCPTAKVGELREQWGITRKHAVPIFEFFDKCAITLREGDLRSAGPRLAFPIGEASP